MRTCVSGRWPPGRYTARGRTPRGELHSPQGFLCKMSPPIPGDSIPRYCTFFLLAGSVLFTLYLICMPPLMVLSI